MNSTIIGGGNIGTLIAAELANKGHSVTVFSSKVEQFIEQLEVYDETRKYLFSGRINKVTNNLGEALADAQYIWITVPSQLFSDISSKMLPYVNVDQKIGIIPGSGGAEFAFRDLINKGCTLFGLQRVHSISRLLQYGHSVMMLGRKSVLHIGSIPPAASTIICRDLELFFDIECIALPNYLSVTLTPSNPILHTARLYSLFFDYEIGKYYPRNFLFYEEWDDFASEVLFACDMELQKLCSMIPFDLSKVTSLKIHYESDTPPELTAKIKSILAFKGLSSPMIIQGEGWIPDFNSRYFTADFKYGLKVIHDIGRVFDCSMPNIDKVWDWYLKVSKESTDDYFHLELSKDKFIDLYKP